MPGLRYRGWWVMLGCILCQMNLGFAKDGMDVYMTYVVQELHWGRADFQVAGWVLLARAYTANDSHDATAAAGLAREAIALAKELGDGDLALCASCELGVALMALGDLDAGGSLLDQAMAAALGGDRDDLDTVVLVSCRTITACS